MDYRENMERCTFHSEEKQLHLHVFHESNNVIFIRSIRLFKFSKHFRYSGICTLRNFEKQPSRGVLRKRCSENIQQIYRRTPMPKCDYNKVAKQHLEHLFLRTLLEGCF